MLVSNLLSIYYEFILKFIASVVFRTHITNNKKYLSRQIGDNFVIEKNVTTKAYKRRITIYDKAKELQKAENKPFLSILINSEKLLSYFNGKIRFEMNLNCIEAIRKSLSITDTYVYNVLNSDANPILNFIDKIIIESTGNHVCSSIKEREIMALLKDCDFNIIKVENELRQYCSKGTHISQVIKPFRNLLDKIQYSGATENLKKVVCEMLLLEIFILIPIFI